MLPIFYSGLFSYLVGIKRRTSLTFDLFRDCTRLSNGYFKMEDNHNVQIFRSFSPCHAE